MPVRIPIAPAPSYLDSAATTQRAASVIEAQARFYRDMNSNPLRGLYDLSIRATEAVNAARFHVARFVGAQDAAGIMALDMALGFIDSIGFNAFSVS